MEGVLQTRGLLSLPSKPKIKAFYPLPQGGLRNRFNSLSSLKPNPFNGVSLSSNGFQKVQGFDTKPQLFGQKKRCFSICKAAAAAAAGGAADGQPLFVEKEQPKFMGIEVVTLKKIIPLNVTALDLGASGINSKQALEIPHFSDYLSPLMEFMASLPADKNVVLVGHSFGGLGISKAMETFPEKISAAVFLELLTKLSHYIKSFTKIICFSKILQN